MQRRDLIKRLNGIFLSLGLMSPLKTLIIDSSIKLEDELLEFAKRKKIKYISDSLEDDKYSKDFGKIFKGKPRIVLIPDSRDQLKEIVLFANTKKIPLSIRGASHSVSGQSLAVSHGVSIDLREFNKIQTIEFDSKGFAVVSCFPGATLGQLNKFLLQSNYMLPALPFFPELTVGGVLGSGGIGSASHQYGLMIANVSELKVLTGEGSLISCTDSKNREIFNSVLGTFGYFGVITNVKLKLIKAGRTFRVHRLLYEDIDQWYSDYELLRKTTSNSHLQGIMIRSAANKARWNFLLEASLQADAEDEFKQYDEVLAKLKYKTKLPSSDLSAEAFMNRYQPRFDDMRKTGKYDQSHPFLEFIIPVEQAKNLINQALKILPPSYEDGFRMIFINKNNLPAYFIVPDSPDICMLAILPSGIQKDDLAVCLPAAEQLHKYAESIGANRYLSGWLGMMNSNDLKKHYGNKATQLTQLKKKMDPNNILRSQFSDKLCDWM